MNLDKFTYDGRFLMLALDHRESFKKLMDPKNPDSVSDEGAISLKGEIIESLADQFSGLLIDQTYGLPAYQNRLKPFLLPVEKTGYTDQAGERLTEIEYSIPQLAHDGASGAKLLLYFNPQLISAARQLEVAKKVAEECQDYDFPFFLEIRVYEPGETGNHQEKPELILGSVKMLIESGVNPDVFKLEYPGSLEHCREVTKLTKDTPWILLTKGDTYEVFKKELEDAIRAGAQGFLAGRALWQEVVGLKGEEKERFLSKTLPGRFREISSIAETA